MNHKWIITIVLAVLMLTVSSCAVNKVYEQAKKNEQLGNWDKAIFYYSKALEKDRNNVDIRLRLETVRRMASKKHMELAREYWDENRYEDSMIEYRTARELDPLNRAALIEFNQRVRELEQMQEARQREEEAAKLKEMEGELESEPERPTIDVNGKEKQSFYFPNQEIGEVYQSMAKLAGINIIYHESVRQKLKQRTDFIINNADFWEAFDYFVMSNNHFYRMVREDTIMIVDGGRTNRQSFEDKAVKVFYLSNAEVRDVYTALRVVVPTGTKLSMIRPHNAILVRDTPQKIAIISKVISILDKPKAEVIIDVEFLEVDSTVINDVGLLLSSYSMTQSFVNPDIAVADGVATNVVPLDQLSLINKSNLFLTIPSLVYNFLKTNSNSKLLAKPQLRITDGEKSELHIGARVPVRKSTFNPGSSAGIGTPVDSYEYESTGIKFTMTPRVHHNGEVSLEMDIEISAIGAGADSTNPTFTTRNIKSKLRLKDGETNLLAGLIREEEKYTEESVAGLSEIPIIGKLFGSHNMETGKTDIIITITPHIVRGGKLTLNDLMAVLTGPEANPGFEGLINMDQLEKYHYLRGIPLSGRGSGGGGGGVVELEEDEYYYEEDEYYYEEDEEDDDEPPTASRPKS